MLNLTKWKIKKLTKKILVLKTNRLNEQPRDEIITKEIRYYFDLANIYYRLIGNKKYPYANLLMQECYRSAANLDNSEANYLLGKQLLEEAKYRQILQNEGVFDSGLNEKKMHQLFEEAHAYLKVADELDHIQAKRLRGLCFINAWGVEPNQETGFDLIVASIEKEGSWDKVPQIFAAMGLNNPEFFSAIMHRRKK